MDSKFTFYERVVRPAFYIHRFGCEEFLVTIKYAVYDKDNRLSITGQYRGNGGQISHLLTLDELIPAEGFEYADLVKLQDIWERWHLNHMRSGTPKQEAFIREHGLSSGSNYDEICEALSKAGLLYNEGHKYGSKHLKEEVPLEVIRYLFSLPAVKGDSWNNMNLVPVCEEELFKILCLG